MDKNRIIEELAKNKNTFISLLDSVTEEEYLWKSKPEKWCLLEIVSHLYDEEREDFRVRVKHVLETPDLPMTPIDPEGWVKTRFYMKNDYDDMLNKFLAEREASILWLQSLKDPEWHNVYQHPEFGSMTASLFLSNWLAHDYLHIRQILKLKFDYLKEFSGETLTYAGDW